MFSGLDVIVIDNCYYYDNLYLIFSSMRCHSNILQLNVSKKCVHEIDNVGNDFQDKGKNGRIVRYERGKM